MFQLFALTVTLVFLGQVYGGYYDRPKSTTATPIESYHQSTSSSTAYQKSTTTKGPIESMPTIEKYSNKLTVQSCTQCQDISFPAPVGGCSGSDCVVYDESSQAVCTLVQNQAPSSSTPLWKAGLNLNVDNQILGGRIVAFQIQYFSGSWSGWFVPGVNDIDVKINPNCGMRRWWSYFVDHVHSYIICK